MSTPPGITTMPEASRRGADAGRSATMRSPSMQMSRTSPETPLAGSKTVPPARRSCEFDMGVECEAGAGRGPPRVSGGYLRPSVALSSATDVSRSGLRLCTDMMRSGVRLSRAMLSENTIVPTTGGFGTCGPFAGGRLNMSA